MTIFGLPDIRWDINWIPLKIFRPTYLNKEYILDPEAYENKKKRPFLLNLYFAKPDYVDPGKKLYYLGLLGLKTSVVVTFFQVIGEKISSVPRATARFGMNTGTFVGLLTLYGSTAYCVANFRGKKDDPLNHLIAGASMGVVASYYYKSSGWGATIGFTTAIATSIIKYFQDAGMYFIVDLELNKITRIPYMRHKGWTDMRMDLPAIDRYETARRRHYNIDP